MSTSKEYNTRMAEWDAEIKASRYNALKKLLYKLGIKSAETVPRRPTGSVKVHFNHAVIKLPGVYR